MDIICPITKPDSNRFTLLFETLNKFYKSKFTLYLVTPEGKSPISDSRIISLADADIDPSLGKGLNHNKGWWKQQLIKIKCCNFCQTNNILVLDADCFAVKKFTDRDLIRNNKILTNNQGHSWENWYRGSSKILRFEVPVARGASVTPIVLSRKILLGLNEYLNDLYGQRFGDLLLKNTHLKGIDNSDTWSEYTLYHLFAMKSGFYSMYHTDDTEFVMYGNSYWTPEDAVVWDASKSFENDTNFFFTVAQSVGGKSALWVREKIQDYL